MKQYLLRFKRQQLVIIMLQIALSALQILSAMSLAPIIDALVRRDLAGIIQWCGISLGIWLLTILNDYILTVYETKIIRLMNNALRADFASTINTYSIAAFNQTDSNQYISWLNNDVKTIEENGFKSFYQLLNSVLTAAFAIGALLFYHYSLALVAIFFSIILMYVPKLFNKIMDRAALQLKNANSQFMSQINDLIGGFTVFKNHQQTITFRQRIIQASDKLGQTNVTYTKKIEAVSDGIGTLSIFSQIFTTGWTAFLIFNKLVNVGVVGTATNLSGLLFSNLSKITTDLFTMRSVQTILNIDLVKQATTETVPHSFNKQLKLHDLSFSYENKPVLKQIDYIFNKNGKYALIGKSGVGKSTLLNLISGQLTGYQGEIILDKQIVNDCASEIEYVEQKPYLFNTTLRDNLELGAHVSTTTLSQICHDLQIDTFMTLDTKIIGHGQNLSGGQRQRIALARALVHRKPIIFLDEVTAGLDEQSAQQIESRLLQDPDLTLVMITHHLTDQTRKQLTGVLDLSVD